MNCFNVYLFIHTYIHTYIYAGLFPRLLFFLSPVVCVCVFFKDFERKRRPLSIIANRVSCCTSRLMAKKSGCQYRVSKPRKDLCGRRLVFSKFTFGFFSQRSRIIFSTVNRYKLEHSKSLSLSLVRIISDSIPISRGKPKKSPLSTDILFRVKKTRGKKHTENKRGAEHKQKRKKKKIPRN